MQWPTETGQKEKQWPTEKCQKEKQWPTEKPEDQKEKQCSTEHYIETKDWTLQIPFKTGDDLMCSGKVSTSNSTICTRRVTHVKNLVKSSERRKKDGL